MLPNSMIQILRAGGSLDIDCSKAMMLPDTMAQLARAAAASGSHFTFRNLSMLLPDTAVRVSQAGSGSVTFVL